MKNMYCNMMTLILLCNYCIADERITTTKTELTENSLDTQDKNGNTLLHTAICMGNLPLAETLVQQGISLNITNKDGLTALHLAIRKGYLNLAKEIIKIIKDKNILNIQDNNGNTPLHIAINMSKLLLAEAMVKQGANLDIKNNDGLTVLHLAVKKGHIDFVEKMLKIIKMVPVTEK